MTVPEELLRIRSLRTRFGPRKLAQGNRLFQAGTVQAITNDTHSLCLQVSADPPGDATVEVRIGYADDTLTLHCEQHKHRACIHQAAGLLYLAEQRRNQGDTTPWQVTLLRGLGDPIQPLSGVAEGDWLRYQLTLIEDEPPIIETARIHTAASGREKVTPFPLGSSWGGDPTEPRPDFLTPIDVHLCRQLRQSPASPGGRRGNHRYELPLEVRYGILIQLATTGRLFLDGCDRPLSPGPTLSARPQVVAGDDGTLRIELPPPAPLSDEWQVLAADPPLYVDDAQVGGLLVPVPGKLAATLAALPIQVPAADLTEFTQHWLPRLLAAGDLDLPPMLTPAQVDGQPPVPHLHLVDGQGELRLHLSFAYGAAQPVVAAGSDLPVALIDGQVVRYSRDRTAEKQAARRLSVPHSPHQLPPRARGADVWSLTGDDAYAFLLEELPVLSKEGWIILGEEHLSRHRVYRGTPRFAARIRSGLDWFDLEVDATFDSQQVDVFALLSAWESGNRFTPLPDGRVVQIPDWIRAHADALHEAGSTAEKGVRLGQYQVPLLLELTEGVTTEADAGFQDAIERLKGFEGIQPVASPSTLKTDLRPYQKDGLAWLDFLREYGFGGILADDMGLGKTVQVIALLLLEKQRQHTDLPSLIVVPTSLIFNWEQELARFAPELSVATWHGPGRHRGADSVLKAEVVLTNYALLRQDVSWFEAQPFHYLVLDESQYVKNPGSQVSRAVRQLNARHRLALTGTPIENHLGELWAQFAFLVPGLLGQHEQFRRRFGGPIERGDAEATEKLSQRVRPFILRRTKQEVASDLPERVETTLMCRMEGEQRALYDTIRQLCREKVAKSIEKRGMARSSITILDALMKLRQVCCDPQLLPRDMAAGVTESAKRTLFMELISEAVEEGHRVLVFSQFVGMLTILRQHLDAAHLAYSYLDGRTRDRARRVQEFQNNPDIPLFLISLKAGGTGLNLTGADYVVHFDPWWNPAVELQATDRAHRIGQTRKVFSYKLITADTVEEKIVALQERKRNLFDQVVGEEAGRASKLELADLEGIFGAF